MAKDQEHEVAQVGQEAGSYQASSLFQNQNIVLGLGVLQVIKDTVSGCGQNISN